MLSTAQKIVIARAVSTVVVGLRRCGGLAIETTVVRRGLRWQLDLNEGIDLSIYLLGGFELRLLRLYRTLVHHGDVVLDIGANIGAHTLPLGHLVGKTGRVVAFEPTQFAFQKLQRNLALNPELVDRTVCEQIMLGEMADIAVPEGVYSSWPLTGDSQLHKKHGGRLMPTIGARTSTLDAYVEHAGIRRVDLVKVDVDGHECAVLRGARSTLMELRPRLIMEFAPYAMEDTRASVEELCEVLSEYRYRLYEASTGKALPESARDLRRLVPDGCGVNVIGAAV